MDNKIKIGFDLDGVILDHSGTKVRLAKNLGFNLKKEQTPTEIIKKILPDDVYKKVKNIMYGDLRLLKASKLNEGIKPLLNKLQKTHIKFFLISRQWYPEIGLAILKYHKLYPKYFNTKNTFFVKEIEDKNTKAKALGLTHYIDDEQRVLNSLLDVENKFLFDKLNVFKDSKYKRIKSWAQFSKII